MLSILFNCKIFKQEILTQAAVPMSCRYKIRHELEVKYTEIMNNMRAEALEKGSNVLFLFLVCLTKGVFVVDLHAHGWG